MSAPGLGPVIGCLEQLPANRKHGAVKVKELSKRQPAKVFIHLGQELIVGRDDDCHLSFDDTTISGKHLKIYSITYDQDSLTDIKPLIYAEDLSRNGSYWNGSYIGKGNGGVLLTDEDELRISPNVTLIFRSKFEEATESRDFTQEDEMKYFRHQYKVTNRKLGSGVHGSVFMAVNLLSGRQSACKVVDLRKIRAREVQKFLVFKRTRDKSKDSTDTNRILKKMSEEYKLRQVREEAQKVLREAEILSKLNHPNIVKLEKVFQTNDTLYIFEELLTGGDLFSYINYRGGKLDEAESAIITRQIVEAIKHLHDNQIVHRDVKPDNILVASLAQGARVVLTDFGFARRIDNPKQKVRRMDTIAGTLDFVAPEVSGTNAAVKEKGYTKAVDLWSLGCVTTAMLTGAAPFSIQDTRSNGRNSLSLIADAAAKCDLTGLCSAPEWQGLADQAKNFVLRLLVLDEKQRMTADEALNHDWFGNTQLKGDFDAVYKKAVSGWRKQIHLPDVVEIIPGYYTSDTPRKRQARRKNCKPIEPHYQPHHRITNSLYAAPKTPLPTIKQALECPQYALRQLPEPSGTKRDGLNSPSQARIGTVDSTRSDDPSTPRDALKVRRGREEPPSPPENSVYFPVQKRKRWLSVGRTSSDPDRQEKTQKTSPASKKKKRVADVESGTGGEDGVETSYPASLSESFP